MVEFFLGKTGSGKSYLALKRVVEFLANHPDGYIVTNLAINIGKLNAWMKEHFPRTEPDVCGRIRILKDEECRRFFLHREYGNDLAAVSKEQEQRLEFPDFHGAAQRSRQVLYIIDEAHIFFDAREWANVGLSLNFFCSQHRKFRCDVIFITQFLKQVELRLREHATQFSECFNYGLRRWAAWKLPQIFTVSLTYKAPPCPSEHNDRYRIDKTLADCYDTTAGVGVSGGFKPEVQRRKGMPFWTLPAAIAACGVVAYFLPDMAEMGIHRVAGGGPTSEKNKPASSIINAGTATPAGKIERPMLGVDTARPGFETPAPLRTLPPLPKDAVKVAGYVVRGNKATVLLTDGRTITESDPGYGGLDRRGTGLTFEGQKVYMQTPRTPPPKTEAPKADSGEVEAPVGAYAGEAVIPHNRIDETPLLPKELPQTASQKQPRTAGLAPGGTAKRSPGVARP